MISLLTSVLLGFSTTILGYPGEGIHFGDLTMNPFVDLAGTYDSNVMLEHTNYISDIFYEAQGGIEFHYEPGMYTLDGRGFAVFRRYTELTDKDFDNYGERASLMFGDRSRLSVYINESYRQIDDYDRSMYYGESVNPQSMNLSLAYDRSMRLKRVLTDVGVILGRAMTDKTELDIALNYTAQEYELERLFDVDTRTAQAELSYMVTDRSALFLTGAVGMENNESFEKPSTSYNIRLGLNTRRTDKVNMKAGVGYTGYEKAALDEGSLTAEQAAEIAAAGANPGTETNSSTSVSFDISATWVATDKLSYELTARNGFQSAQQYANTLNLVSLGSINAVYNLTESVVVSLTGSYRRDDYRDDVLEERMWQRRLDERYAALLRADYTLPARFLSVYLEGSYELDKSTVLTYNYDQLRISIGASVRY